MLLLTTTTIRTTISTATSKATRILVFILGLTFCCRCVVYDHTEKCRLPEPRGPTHYRDLKDKARIDAEDVYLR
jgi:hypothetical protein